MYQDTFRTFISIYSRFFQNIHNNISQKQFRLGKNHSEKLLQTSGN